MFFNAFWHVSSWALGWSCKVVCKPLPWYEMQGSVACDCRTFVITHYYTLYYIILFTIIAYYYVLFVLLIHHYYILLHLLFLCIITKSF